MAADPGPDLKVVESGGPNALTPRIRPRIHSATTQEAIEPEATTEMDRIAIQHLIDTLAEVALAVARRQSRGVS
jgi:hypothetical protein